MMRFYGYFRFFRFFSLLVLVGLPAFVHGEAVKELVIENKGIKRVLSFENGICSTTGYYLPGLTFNFVATPKVAPINFKELGDKAVVGEFRYWHGPSPKEFSFLVNGVRVTGHTGWKVCDIRQRQGGTEKDYEVVLEGTSEINRSLRVTLTYVLYEDYPLIRKNIVLTNLGEGELKIEELDVESLNVSWGNTHTEVYGNYGRYKHVGAYTGKWDDPLLIVHNPIYQLGYIAGNEAPGVMKRTTACVEDGRDLSIGLTHNDNDHPFRVWLGKNESFTSPWTFTGVFKKHDPREVVETDVADFVRKYMGIRLSVLKERPIFVYNTWQPFRGRINEKLIMELADAAAACGIEEFVIDDGWQANFGDWDINRNKFPNGLKPVFDHMKSLGLKPGLWLSMGAVSTNSKVFKEHPEWFVKSENQDFVNLHTDRSQVVSACFATEWKDYLKGKILGLVKEHGLEYVKLDFAIITSAYRFDKNISGCYAKNHHHKDREESFLKIYRAAWQLFDELHEEAPKLFIDCTFETMGKLNLVDFDMCKHAEGNWLSNFESPAPIGSLRARYMSWWRSSVIPATALVIGNQSLDDKNALYSYKTLCGALPIMLGDPRAMSPEKRDEIKRLSVWMRSMDRKHQIMLFRQDLPGFGAPTYGHWDGFQRINTETKSGGILGVFKHFSPVKEQWITINYLAKDKKYKVLRAGTKKVIATGTGEELRVRGFKVHFDDDFQGELYEVCLK